MTSILSLSIIYDLNQECSIIEQNSPVKVHKFVSLSVTIPVSVVYFTTTSKKKVIKSHIHHHKEYTIITPHNHNSNYVIK